MCGQVGLLVCLTCLALSAAGSSAAGPLQCDPKRFIDKYGSNGTLSLLGLSEMFKGHEETCRSLWKNIHSEATAAPSLGEPPSDDHSDGDQHDNHPHEEKVDSSSAASWWYACLSVLFISGCGLGAVATIKIVPNWLFQPSIQFLVALAVGTLTGDAILHLIPHALIPEEPHGGKSHHNVQDEDAHEDNEAVWKGAVMLTIFTFFFIIERLLTIFGEWRGRKQSAKQVAHVAQLVNTSSKMVGDKLCRHHQDHHGDENNRHNHNGGTGSSEKASSDATANETKTDLLVKCLPASSTSDKPVHLSSETGDCMKDRGTNCAEWQGLLVGKPLIYCASHDICDGSDAAVREPADQQQHHQNQTEATSASTPATKDLEADGGGGGQGSADAIDSLTVFISEHHTSHHGHSHSHGHVHARTKGVASLAWLVLFGDGIHNLTDGLAIGAAFAASITNGFTTAIAVLCHELPHELGDFAVLLKAGMTMKQAVICNLISSMLCLMGVIIGLAIGSAQQSAPWIFAATAGMFLYIALVDMVPELKGHVGTNLSSFCQLLIQVAGMLLGFGIMLTIALHEHTIRSMFQA